MGERPSPCRCDDGGAIAECETCKRCFHLDPECDCNPFLVPKDALALLALDPAEENEYALPSFNCPDCLQGVSHCFRCHKECPPGPGSQLRRCSRCINAYCDPCLADLGLGQGADLQCPLHRCASPTCAKAGGHNLVACRRCPVAFHDDCIPAEVRKAGLVFYTPGMRSMMYCTHHGMRDQVCFGGTATPGSPAPAFLACPIAYITSHPNPAATPGGRHCPVRALLPGVRQGLHV